MIGRQAVVGFGFGLLFAAGFLYVYPVQQQKPEAPSAALSTEELEAAAKAQGKVMLSAEEYRLLAERGQSGGQTVTDNSSSPTPAAVRPREETDQNPLRETGTAASPLSSQEAVDAETIGQKQGTDREAADGASQLSASHPSMAFQETEHGVVVHIASGLTSSEVADLLYKSGLIHDKQAFVERLWQMNKHRDIRMGTYTISRGTKTDEIIRMITARPNG
ncbi:MAG: endolytic transglycosylase MltG [Brevibacillus sp.]|nr:endolytic transglycosylase MltG [Brevibacillus sp.]